MEDFDQRRLEFFLAGAGSTDVNGSYTQTNSEEDEIFYEKRPKDSWYINRENGESTGLVFIITQDSLPEKGEDFEVAWVLKSPDAVIFYAAPSLEEDEEMPPLKGWVALEGLEPAPSLIIERPVQHPRECVSNLDIIVEDEEREFSLPYWEPDDQKVPGSVDEMEPYDTWIGWDSGQDDSDEIELPTDLMDNFKDGIFNHRTRTNSVERMSDGERRSFDDREGKDDGGNNIFMDSESSEDQCIVRHDTLEYDSSGRLDRISSISSQGDGEPYELNEELTVESPRGGLDESDMTSSTSQLDQVNSKQESKEAPLSLEIKCRKSEELSAPPLGQENGNDSARSPRSLPSPGKREGSRHGSQVIRRSGSQKQLVITLPEDPFSTPSHSRYRRSRDYIDVDLVTAPPELLAALSPRRKSARRSSGRNFETEFPFQMRRRRSSERRSPRGRERSNSNDNTAGRERSNSNDNSDEPEGKPITERKKSEEVAVISDVKEDEKKVPQQEEDGNRSKLKKEEILELQKEAHLLKTKMRKCDRISKVRKRGTSLSKKQQELLVKKSNYQHRYEEIKKLLGSDNIK